MPRYRSQARVSPPLKACLGILLLSRLQHNPQPPTDGSVARLSSSFACLGRDPLEAIATKPQGLIAWLALPWLFTLPSSPPGMQIVGEIEAPGFLEGGDFFPMGQDLALIGIGLRRLVMDPTLH